MQRNWTLGLCGLVASMAFTLVVWGDEDIHNQAEPEVQPEIQAGVNRAQAIARFRAENPGAGLHFEVDDRISRVHSQPFARGQSPHDSAEQFRQAHAGLWGIMPQDLIPVSNLEDGRHLQPIMYENGQPKFTGVYYTQMRDGVEVFRSRLIVLVRNVANYPSVLASADLRDVGEFHVGGPALAAVNAARGVAAARNYPLDNGQRMPRDSVFTPARTIIFAGVDEQPHPPTLAVNFIGEGGDPTLGNYERREFVADAVNGAILYQESLVQHVNVSGNVSALTTDGDGADICAAETPRGLPYLNVSISGGSSTFTDVNGNFTIPNAGATPVTVLSPLTGQYFVVQNQQGPTSSVTLNNVTPPGPANVLHNSANATEHTRAEVNAYLHANMIRDLVVHFNPAYPEIGTQTNFPVRVNINLTCNAFYSASTINFYISGACPPPSANTGSNSAFSTVVHHEFGHHVVDAGGSGQGAYGEGTGDIMAVLVSDQPHLGIGFYNNDCNAWMRNADNNCQYQTSGCSSCGSQIHACGQLISGCVWSLRNELFATNPATYREILGNLAVNAVLLHNGSTITPAIAIDYLTLDDNDGDLLNGGPHRAEIAAGFGDHNMAPPALPLAFTYPLGRPEFVSPGGGNVLRVVIGAADATPAPGATLNIDTGAGFTGIPMTLVGSGTYEAAFPATPCGTVVKYYVSAQTTSATTATSPSAAPGNFFVAPSASSLGAVAFTDNFQSSLGWTVSNTATDGFWTRVTPNTVCVASPHADGDGSGLCFVTDNSSNCGSSDVDGGATTLTSPIMDASVGPVVLSYWRWYFNNAGTQPHNDTLVVEVSSNGGTTWLNLETVGPIVQADGGWFFRSFNLGSIPGFTLTNQFRIRFIASDTGTSSTIEAAVDGVKLQRLNCAASAPGDVNGDGDVDVDDLLAVLSAWGPCLAPPAACPADVVVDGQVNVSDLLFVITNWG